MLLISGAVVVAIAVAIISRVRVPRGVNTLGWMSEQWLADHRASHSP